MRKLMSVVVYVLILGLSATGQVKRIAILETLDKENKVPYAVEVMVRSNLTKVISNTSGYEGYDRVNISEIMDEHDFERTGLVSEEQIRRLGEISGADFILVSEAVKFDESNIFVTAKILNVVSAKTEGSENALMGMTAQDIQHGCESLANRLLGRPDPWAQSDYNTSGTNAKPTTKAIRKNDEEQSQEPLIEVEDNNDEVVEQASIMPISDYQGTLVRDGRNLLLNGHELSDEEVGALVGEQNYQTYLSAKKLIGLGKTFGGIFYGTLGATIVFLAADLSGGDYLEPMMITGIAAGASLPLMCVFKGIGKNRMNRVVDDYNKRIGASVSYHLSPSLIRVNTPQLQDDIALGMTFSVNF